MIRIQLLADENNKWYHTVLSKKSGSTCRIEIKDSSERVGGSRKYASDMSSHSSGRRRDWNFA
jgi:hypothetical protein